MKPCINLFIALIFVLNSAFTNDDFKKEKKALMETIKKEYVISIARNYPEWLKTNFSSPEKSDSTIKPMASDLKLNARINSMPLDCLRTS